jgi:hypothetical protein
MTKSCHRDFGWLAAQTGRVLPLQVCRSRAGYYIGTRDETGAPYSRESLDYWPQPEKAEAALKSGTWRQKQEP